MRMRTSGATEFEMYACSDSCRVERRDVRLQRRLPSGAPGRDESTTGHSGLAGYITCFVLSASSVKLCFLRPRTHYQSYSFVAPCSVLEIKTYAVLTIVHSRARICGGILRYTRFVGMCAGRCSEVSPSFQCLFAVFLVGLRPAHACSFSELKQFVSVFVGRASDFRSKSMCVPRPAGVCVLCF